MTGRLITGVGLVAMALLGAGLGGCQEAKLKDDVARLQTENEALKSEKQSLTTQLASAEQRAATAQPVGRPFTEGGQFKPTGDRAGTPTRHAPVSETRIEVAGDKLFASGSTTIMASGKAELDKVATRIKKEFPGAGIRVEGYTDTDPPNKIKHKFPTNEALSLARAQEVEKYLAMRGVPSGQIDAVGMGAANPKATKAASRRVEIVVIGS